MSDYWGTLLKYIGIFALLFLLIWLVSGCALFPKGEAIAETGDITGIHNQIPVTIAYTSGSLAILLLACYTVRRLTRAKR